MAGGGARTGARSGGFAGRPARHVRAAGDDPADGAARHGSSRRARAGDDRDEYDAAEGQPVDEVEQPRSIEERRRAIHEQAQQALGEMKRSEPHE